MLSVVDNQLVIEEKGIYSVQKFLVSRHIMYLQVYLHKNSIVAEQMLKSFVHRLKYLVNNGAYPLHNSKIERLLTDNQIFNKDFDQNLKTFTTLDDVDVMFTIKNSVDSADQILEAYARGLLNRSLFKVLLSKKPFDSDLLTDLRQNVKIQYSVSDLELDQLIISGKETTGAYDTKVNEIKILMKSGEVRPISDCLDTLVNMEDITQYYLCYPK